MVFGWRGHLHSSLPPVIPCAHSPLVPRAGLIPHPSCTPLSPPHPHLRSSTPSRAVFIAPPPLHALDLPLRTPVPARPGGGCGAAREEGKQFLEMSLAAGGGKRCPPPCTTLPRLLPLPSPGVCCGSHAAPGRPPLPAAGPGAAGPAGCSWGPRGGEQEPRGVRGALPGRAGTRGAMPRWEPAGERGPGVPPVGCEHDAEEPPARSAPGSQPPARTGPAWVRSIAGALRGAAAALCARCRGWSARSRAYFCLESVTSVLFVLYRAR